MLDTSPYLWKGVLSVLRTSLFSAVPPRECRHLAAISAQRHGTPFSPVRSRIIVKEKLTVRIAALLQSIPGAFGNQLSSRPCNRSQQPLESLVLCEESQPPASSNPLQLVVPFRNAKNFVDRVEPLPLYVDRFQHRSKRRAHA